MSFLVPFERIGKFLDAGMPAQAGVNHVGHFDQVLAVVALQAADQQVEFGGEGRIAIKGGEVGVESVVLIEGEVALPEDGDLDDEEE